MGGAGEQQVPTVAEPVSPGDFLGKLGKALRGKQNVDTGLADILALHILTATPAVDAVANAKDAILKLAAERADPPKPEPVNG